ncbi:ABC transporter ATP-binding protein [Deinococcus peraridilitoris]|uniref:ABC-type cobalamin/Fe3+-siderophore transport system, ATPase component n=1 Tax=Deinococcus peraridilitoris (strain DSM 19664 / LMG 22246 / CIP 109416 / KR-200) TaxID=937777 RepID=L0A5W4_DEIPD|nr:ABC transporter ATP-binding protein [Deinococcus peraridilitoris]AFZ69273.1 ABC-type cobalamin/Fe3+-siderophore transport system, ATPase component [Deinococcus peraridilitoris DSM 19664]
MVSSTVSEFAPFTPTRPGALSTRTLSLRYGTRRVIEDLDLTLPGGVTTIIGANGCGKSTLLRSLSRLLNPERGSVLLDGHDLHRLPTKVVAQKLAILPQGPSAPEGLTVEELVWFGRHPHQGMFAQRSKEDRDIVAWALDHTGMRVFATRPLENLSGGQRQRAWIAMSLAQGTSTLLLDEPTTYLDLSHQLEVLHLVRRLNEEEGKTIIMVLHDLNQAVRYSDELVAVQGGKVYAQGHPASIMNKQLLRDVFGLEAHLLEDPDTGRPYVIPYGIARRSSSEGKPDGGKAV